MEVSLATDPGAAGVNDDFVVAAPDVVVVLDGLTVPPSADTSCSHGTPWYVHQLGTSLLRRLSGRPGVDLQTALAEAIGDTAGLHASTCDLSHPGTPSATVAVLRERAHHVDVLVLADAAVLVDVGDDVHVLVDRRVDEVALSEAAVARAAPSGTARRDAVASLVAAQLEYRNQPGGYWIAGARPDAAEYALTATMDRTAVRRAAALTDGATRYADMLGMGSWRDLLDVLDVAGPAALLTQVRAVEITDPSCSRWPRFKTHDDATVAACRWPQ